MKHVFRATMELNSTSTLAWLVEANDLDEAISATREYAPKVLEIGWKLRSIEDLGQLMIRR